MVRWTIAALIAVWFNTCVPATNPNVGSSADTQIPNMTFTVDSTYLNYAVMVAQGKVTNSGTANTTPPWYVEAQFYTDTTYLTKLGGNSTEMTFPLSPGQSTFWSISFSSTNVDVRSFPYFNVKDIRAIYKKS